MIGLILKAEKRAVLIESLQIEIEVKIYPPLIKMPKQQTKKEERSEQTRCRH